MISDYTIEDKPIQGEETIRNNHLLVTLSLFTIPDYTGINCYNPVSRQDLM